MRGVLDRAPALTLSDELEDAMRARLPIVAIESALLLHALPYPDNVACVRRCIDLCRQRQVVPAFAVMSAGQLAVGIDTEQFAQMAERIASSPLAVRLVCAADLAAAMHSGWSGGISPAATLVVARLIGAAVCVTSALSGVRYPAHGGATASADLHALSRYPVGVVTAGLITSAPALGDSADYLRTRSVAVVGFRCHQLPRFLVAADGAPATQVTAGGAPAPAALPLSVHQAAECAALLRSRLALNQTAAIVIAQPCAAAAISDAAAIAAYRSFADEQARLRSAPPLLTTCFGAAAPRALHAATETIVANCRLAADISIADAR